MAQLAPLELAAVAAAAPLELTGGCWRAVRQQAAPLEAAGAVIGCGDGRLGVLQWGQAGQVGQAGQEWHL